MKSAALASIRVAGLTSIHDLTLELHTPVTVLIGPNGSGKSNLVGALELLGRITDRQFQSYVLRRGGFSSFLHRSARPGLSANQVSIEVRGDLAEDGSTVGYRAVLQPASGDQAVVSEALLGTHTLENDSDWEQILDLARESRLSLVTEGDDDFLAQKAREVLPILTGCRIFHFQDTSSDAPVKNRAKAVDNLTLAPDARNLAALLGSLRVTENSTYRRIVRAVQTVAPFFDDFILDSDSGTILLRWREKGLDDVFSADDLSDGTLRFICLATLLLQPDRPGTVVLDEPELGLHPFAIGQLAGLIRDAAGDGRKIVLATQSVTLLSHFDVAEVAVIERGFQGTTVSRLDAQELGIWLSDYSLGELWEKNLLGGRPRPDPDRSEEGQPDR